MIKRLRWSGRLGEMDCIKVRMEMTARAGEGRTKRGSEGKIKEGDINWNKLWRKNDVIMHIY